MVKIIFVGLLLFSCSVSQASSELELLLAMLKDNGTITSEQYDRVMIEFSNNQSPLLEQQILSAQSIPSTSKITVKNGIKVQSIDNAFETQIGGRIEAYAAWYNDDNMDMGDTQFRHQPL